MNKSCIVERIISNHFESFLIHKKINNGHHSIYQFVSKNTYYILKFDNKSITKNNMLNEIEFYKNAKNYHINDSIPVLYFYGQLNSHFYLIIEFIDGLNLLELPSLSSNLFNDLINLLNKLHLKSSQIKNDISRHIDELVRNAISKLGNIQSILSISQKLIHYLNNTKGNLRLSNLCIVHGDFTPRNLIYSKIHNRIYLIDFEWSKKSIFYYDICKWIIDAGGKKNKVYINFIYYYLKTLPQDQDLIAHLNFFSILLMIDRLYYYSESINKSWLNNTAYNHSVSLIDDILNGGNVLNWVFQSNIKSIPDFNKFALSSGAIIK